MKKIVVLNHKTSLDFENVKYYIDYIKDRIRSDMDIVVCPSDIFIPFFKGKYSFKLGAQNISSYPSTGEVSGSILKSLGVSYVIVGHSDRKKYFGEDTSLINKKIKEALKYNIKPILCVGETLEERGLKKTQDVIIRQIRESLRGIDVKQDIIIAYEPVFSIGTGMMPALESIKEVVTMIKNSIYRAHGVNVKVIYGGSINENNITKLDQISEIDGFLIGNSSVNPEKLIKILELID
jgi:triosephosphate isomerase